MKSIISSEKKCYVCGVRTNLHLHHIWYGRNRTNADKDGLTVYLCWEHHEGTLGVHGKYGHELDMRLKKIAQYSWCKHYDKTSNDFIERYHHWYI